MRVAVTGTTGRVGGALVRHFSAKHEVIPLPRGVYDLADAGSLADALDDLECDVFINPAGNTSLEECEDNPAMAMRVNANAPGEIAAWAAEHGVRVVHFSTDYVFGGEREGLRGEEDAAVPVSVYGRSKLAGERAVLDHPGNCVLRVSWVSGPDKASFIDSIFDAALAGRPLAAVADKLSLPTFTGDLAEWLDILIERQASGIFHACNSGEPITWHDLATAACEEMAAGGLISEVPEIRRQTLAECTSFRAERPRFTAMDTRRLTAVLGRTPRHWREALAEHIRHRGLTSLAEKPPGR